MKDLHLGSLLILGLPTSLRKITTSIFQNIILAVEIFQKILMLTLEWALDSGIETTF